MFLCFSYPSFLVHNTVSDECICDTIYTNVQGYTDKTKQLDKDTLYMRQKCVLLTNLIDHVTAKHHLVIVRHFLKYSG